MNSYLSFIYVRRATLCKHTETFSYLSVYRSLFCDTQVTKNNRKLLLYLTLQYIAIFDINVIMLYCSSTYLFIHRRAE